MEIFRFHFNSQYASDLRNAVNDRRKQSIDNVHTDKQIKREYYAWGRTCAAMDRLQDTLNYLNSIELGGRQNSRSAFDFYDFINNAYVVIDCIKTLGRIFRLDDNLIRSIETSTSVFGAGTDGKYFEYIRSLCVVHPLCTNHQSEYLNGRQFHCCPFVIWRSHPCHPISSDADLTAIVYPSDRWDKPQFVGLYISQFEAYLEKWIDLIPKIIEAKNEYADTEYERLRKTHIMSLSEQSNDVVRHLLHLRDEYCKRFDYGDDYTFDHYIRVFSIELSDERNKELLTKYRNAILYSLQFERKALQTMSFDGYENTGIKYPDRGIDTTLFDSLCVISTYGGPFSKYNYNLEKLSYLEKDHFDPGNKQYARILLEEIKALINQYVYFTNQESDEETIVLVELALYLDSLTRKSLLNKNIPNEIAYRVNLLSEGEYEELIAEEEADESAPISQEEFLKLIKEYGG